MIYILLIIIPITRYVVYNIYVYNILVSRVYRLNIILNYYYFENGSTKELDGSTAPSLRLA